MNLLQLLLKQTAAAASLGFRVQELEKELSSLKTSQQTNDPSVKVMMRIATIGTMK